MLRSIHVFLYYCFATIGSRVTLFAVVVGWFVWVVGNPYSPVPFVLWSAVGAVVVWRVAREIAGWLRPGPYQPRRRRGKPAAKPLPWPFVRIAPQRSEKPGTVGQAIKRLPPDLQQLLLDEGR